MAKENELLGLGKYRDHTITIRTKEDLLTESDLERIHFDISATIEPE